MDCIYVISGRRAVAMNLMVQYLAQDHKQFIEVLYHLEREVKAYGGLTANAPSLDKILDILDYIKVYPQIWHHPIEDIIYETLLSKDIPSPKVVADLMEEHAILDMLTDYLHQIFNAMSQGHEEPVVKLVKKTSELIHRQLKHIKDEQNVFFPLLEQYLTSEDWDAIQRRLEGQINTAGEVKWQEYKSLYRNIVSGSALTAN
jgi:hemerythrin-like domain-containing protein